jgi:type IV secretory pathway TraG/TraD family ATPase VirD4
MVSEEQWKKRVLTDPLLTPGLITKDGRKVTLIADIPNLTETEMQAMMAGIKEKVGPIVDSISAKMMVSGVLPLQTKMTSLLSQELVNFFVSEKTFLNTEVEKTLDVFVIFVDARDRTRARGIDVGALRFFCRLRRRRH